MPSQRLALPMAMPLAGVGSWGEQAVSIMEQTSRCCMVCLMPQSKLSGSFENPHFNMFILDQVTLIHIVQMYSAPAGSCSSALMLRCTLASRGSSLSSHNSMRAAVAIVLMASFNMIKLLRHCRRGITPSRPFSGCLWSVVSRVCSVRIATALLMYAVASTSILLASDSL